MYQIFLIRKYGIWTLRKWKDLRYKIKDVIKEPIILDKILNASRLISERGRDIGGAGIIIGNYKELEPHITNGQSLSKSVNIKDLPIEDLIRHSTSADGHVVIDENGIIKKIHTKFRAEGGRLASIKDICNKTSSFGISISKDAKISIINKDNILYES